MRLSFKVAAVACVAALVPLLMAPSGGVPSRLLNLTVTNVLNAKTLAAGIASGGRLVGGAAQCDAGAATCTQTNFYVGSEVLFYHSDSGDASRTSTTTLADDVSFVIPSLPIGTYQLQYFLHFAGPVAGGAKYGWNASGTLGFFSETGACNNATYSGNYIRTAVPSCSMASGEFTVVGNGYIVTTSAAAVSMQWAQLTSSATPTVLKADSIMVLKRVK